MNKIVTTAALFGALTLSAQESSELQQQLDELKAKVSEIEASKNSLKLASPDTELEIGGRIEISAFYTKNGDGSITRQIDNKKSKLSTTARDSRIWVKSATPTKYGIARTLVELDFQGAGGDKKSINGHTTRLRHAFATIGGWTFGQNNSAFNSLALPDTIGYSANFTMVRQPQVRYAHSFGDLQVELSLEQPETIFQRRIDDNKPGVDTGYTPDRNKSPDVIMRVVDHKTFLSYGGAFMGRYITNGNASKAKMAYGANLFGRIDLFEMDDIRFDMQAGEGIGRYINFHSYQAAALLENNDIRLAKNFGASVAYRHWWSTEIRSTLSLSHARNENDTEHLADSILGGLNRSQNTLLINTFIEPIKNTQFGVEYIRSQKELESKEKIDFDMLSVSFRYDF